jgi:hypothetical protein
MKARHSWHDLLSRTEESVKRGMEAQSKKFVEGGAEVYVKA